MGHIYFSIVLQNYRSDLTMFCFSLLDMKRLNYVYIKYVIIIFTVLFIVNESGCIATMYVTV